MSFTPQLMTVIDITRANPAVVTTEDPHGLTTGQVVRMKVPKVHGMVELDNLLAQVTVISSNTFSLQFSQCKPEGQVNIDSRLFQSFVDTTAGTPAQAVAVGSAPTPITSPQPYSTNMVCQSLIGDATTNNSTIPIPF